MGWVRVKADELSTVLALDQNGFMTWLEDDEDQQSVDADKAWQGIHAVLTQTAWPKGHELDGLVFGGTPFGVEIGNGPPRYLTPDDVATIAARIEPIHVEDFEARIDLSLLARLDVYPGIWGRPEEAADNVTYLSAGYESVREAFLTAATNGEAMIVFLM